jgi:hypothetical protein
VLHFTFELNVISLVWDMHIGTIPDFLNIKRQYMSGTPTPFVLRLAILDADDAVVMSLDTYDSMMETFHLMKAPANVSVLRNHYRKIAKVRPSQSR